MTATNPLTGTTVWQELHVRSGAGLADFYRAVLGWQTDLEAGRFTRDGETVAGVRVDGGFEDAEVGWRAFLGTDDLGETIARVEAAGGSVQHRPASTVIGADAVELTDPFGAWFGLAQLPVEGAVPPSMHLGHLSLVDPTNHDVEQQIAFQGTLFDGETVEVADHGIHFWRNAEGTALRGSYEVEEAARAFLPPHWLCWFNVADQAAAARAAEANGGRVNTVDNELSFGLWGVVVDPQGGEFKVLELTRDRF